MIVNTNLPMKARMEPMKIRFDSGHVIYGRPVGKRTEYSLYDCEGSFVRKSPDLAFLILCLDAQCHDGLPGYISA